MIVSGSGDETGYHLYVASHRHEWSWRVIATIDPGGATDEPWVGYQCVTADGRFAAVVTAPRGASNVPAGIEHGAFAYSVELSTGRVRPLAEHVALMYFDPGCGAGHAITLSRYLEGEERRTSVSVFDASTGKQTWSHDYGAEITSAVPTATGVFGTVADRVVRLRPRGLHMVSAVAGRPFDLRAAKGSAVQFLVARGKRSIVEALRGASLHRSGSGPLLSTDLYQGRGGRNVLVTTGRHLWPGFRVVRPPSQGGTVLAASLGGDVVLSDPPGSPPTRSALSRALGRGNSVSGEVLSDSAGRVLHREKPSRPMLDVYTRMAGEAPGRPGVARASVNTTTPKCSVPRLDLNRQVMQPNANQVNWAIQQATRGLLKGSVLTRPENYAHMGLVAYSPSSDFAPIPLSGGGVVPPSVMDAIFAQESNWYQASFHDLPGVPGDPLVADYYGAQGGINEINYENSDCGYGIGQVTTGMNASDTSPFSEHGKWKIAVDYAENIAASIQILAEKWNTLAANGITLNNGSASYLENWYFAIWAYNTGFYPNTGGPWGLGWTNNPQNASYPPNRKPFLRTTYADAAHPADWPYQERVMGFMETPLFNYRGERSYATPNGHPGGQIQIPGFSDFCNASNNCSPSYHNPSDPELDYCELGSRQCWWHSHVDYANCPTGCATSTYTVSETQTEPANDPNYLPECDSKLTPGTIVVDDESSDINMRGCSPSNWSNQGSFSVEYGKDGNGVPIGVIDWHQLGVGFGGHDYFTHNRNVGDLAHIDTGTWTPGKIKPGLYAIQAHIPDNGATTESATYTIYRGDGTLATRSINQHVGGNQWIPLGDFELKENGAKVTLTNVNGEASGTKDVAYDAISFTFLANPKTSAQEQAAQFEPVLKFDSSEKWRPLNLTSFFGETNEAGELRQHKCIPFSSPDAATILGEGTTEGFKEEPGDFYVLEPAGETTFKVDVARCVPVSTVAEATSWRSSDAYIDIGPLGHSDEVTSYHSPHPECVYGVLLDCNGDEMPNDPYSAIYYAVTDTSGHPFIEYWYFYRYNSFSDTILTEHSHHEGDWEATAVAPAADGSHFEYASFSQHGQWFNYVRNVLHCADEAEESCGTDAAPKGKRVVDYVANGDQSNYPTPCVETEGHPPFSSCPRGAGGAIGDRGHDGADTWGHDFDGEALLPMPAIGSGNWAEWPGHWGATPEDESSAWLEPGYASPQSPGKQGMFQQPWGECGQDVEADPCATPSKTSLAPATRAGTLERLSGECGTWFGAEVVALACDPARLHRTVARRRFGRSGDLKVDVRRSVQVRRAPSGDRTGTAPGIAQALGAPLRRGDEIVIHGHVTAGTVLAVRVLRRGHQVRRYLRPMPGSNVREVATVRGSATLRIGSSAGADAGRVGR